MSLAVHFANTYDLQVSSRNWSQVYGNILKSHRLYRRLWQRNVDGSETLMPWISQISEFKSTAESFWGGNWFIHFDHSVIICIPFGSNQWPVS